jgi:hypothetical protein
MIILFQIFSLVNFCSATMARKKDKEKTYSKALVLKPKYTIAASPAISSIALTNRFLAFSPGPPISYFSTLASAYDPFVDSSQKPKAPFIKYDKPSAYVVVPYFQHLFPLRLIVLTLNFLANWFSHISLPIFIGFLNISQRISLSIPIF